MGAFVARRLITAAFLLLGVSVIGFLILNLDSRAPITLIGMLNYLIGAAARLAMCSNLR